MRFFFATRLTDSLTSPHFTSLEGVHYSKNPALRSSSGFKNLLEEICPFTQKNIYMFSQARSSPSLYVVTVKIKHYHQFDFEIAKYIKGVKSAPDERESWLYFINVVSLFVLFIIFLLNNSCYTDNVTYTF